MRPETKGAISALLTADPTISPKHRKAALDLLARDDLERELAREPIITYAQAANRLAVTTRRIQQLVAEKKLVGVSLGGERCTRVTESSLAALIHSQQDEVGK